MSMEKALKVKIKPEHLEEIKRLASEEGQEYFRKCDEFMARILPEYGQFGSRQPAVNFVGGYFMFIFNDPENKAELVTF